ncbi:uncharacterized protein TP_0285-like [Ylistrum balloti]|uniref:uncharacterized protein TP_0285-like n=1 Tax=Ylistrum balloti TaxID=509963 RepID=UPI002905D3D0|nr:uncharacterized protein TP_0285-like [Ylistrum balloti]
MIVEILRRSTLPVLENIRQQNNIEVSRECFQKIIAVDVNTFDLENHYAEISLRTLRLSFFSDNLQDQFVINKIKKLFSPRSLPDQEDDYTQLNYVDFAKKILDHRDLLRTIPKYYEIAITNRVEQDYQFSPKLEEEKADMSIEDFKKILDKVEEFSHQPIIAIEGFGEMTAHPQWKDFVNEVINRDLSCFLETAGIFWDEEVSNYWLQHPKKDFLTIIFKVEAIDNNLYKDIRGDRFPLDEILNQIEYYLLRRPEGAYLQTIKTTETFKHLPKYHEYFSKYTKNIIIGKYNHYRGHLPEKRISPMEPFEQIDCWHLKRDFKIDCWGDVWMCKQDFQKEFPLGNLFEKPIKEIYQKGQDYFEKHLQKWSFCKKCDEYYTYNF